MENKKEITYAEEIAQKSSLPLGWIEDYTQFPKPTLDDVNHDYQRGISDFTIVQLLDQKPLLLICNLC
jgi:hypothetical protein